MNDELFNECSKHYEANEKEFWNKLALFYGFSSANALRKKYQRARKARGLSLKIKQSNFDTLDNTSEYTTQKTIAKKDLPKILVFDIETSPLLAFVWGAYDQTIQPSNIIQDYVMFSWSAKWLFEKEIMSDVLTSDEANSHDDDRICRSIWNLINEADIVVTYNGDSFDLKKLNSRFIKNGLLLPNQYKHSVDLYKVMKSKFSMTSNKLDYVNAFLGLEQKIETGGFELWKKCYFGDSEALATMQKYNKNDVAITEMLYLKILPWITNHPNLNVWVEGEQPVCKNCGSDVLVWGNDYYYTATAKYQVCHCDNCGSMGRAKTNLLTKEKRKILLV
jgi:DNA polymerase elongation subunit (family B)